MAFGLTRRALLRGIGGTAVGLPLLDAMVGRAYAQAAMGVPRFVMVYCGIGPCGEGRNQTTGMPDEHVLPLAPGP